MLCDQRLPEEAILFHHFGALNIEVDFWLDVKSARVFLGALRAFEGRLAEGRWQKLLSPLKAVFRIFLDLR